MVAKITYYNTIEGLNRAVRAVPKEAAPRLREASGRIAGDVASVAASRARSVGGPLRRVAPTIKAGKDRVPVVRMGGTTRMRKGKNQTVGNLMWGAEFGGRAQPTTQQFLPHLGRTGYALWPTVRAMSGDIREEYSKALRDALRAI